MATNAGVWLDHKQAIVILITKAGKEIKKIAFDIGQPTRSGGSSSAKNPYKAGEFVPESTLQRKVGNDRNNYYDEVLAAMRGAESILILGPGEAKGEFLKRLKSKKLPGVKVKLETADKMTDRQVAALVDRHFAVPVADKPPTAKDNVKTKGTQAMPGKRPKKSGK